MRKKAEARLEQGALSLIEPANATSGAKHPGSSSPGNGLPGLPVSVSIEESREPRAAKIAALVPSASNSQVEGCILGSRGYIHA